MISIAVGENIIQQKENLKGYRAEEWEDEEE